MKFTSIIINILFLTFQQNTNLSDFEFLKGEWKVEGKETYEFWMLNKNGDLRGNTYDIINGQRIIKETLGLKLKNDKIVYHATVPDQNEGKTVSFTLNTNVKSCFSFENAQHDFPKKIQYEKISENEILIRIMGDKEEGFSYKLIRQ